MVGILLSYKNGLFSGATSMFVSGRVFDHSIILVLFFFGGRDSITPQTKARTIPGIQVVYFPASWVI